MPENRVVDSFVVIVYTMPKVIRKIVLLAYNPSAFGEILE